MASGTTLHFDPDQYPDDTLKAFNEFIQYHSTSDTKHNTQIPQKRLLTLQLDDGN